MSDLAALIKALNVAVSVAAFGVAGLFVLALALRWEEADRKVRRFLWADIVIFGVAGLFTGNLAWAYYLDGADPLKSIAHLWIRLTYLIGGIIGFQAHAANVLRGRYVWWRVFLALLTAEALLIAVLYLLEAP